MMTNEIEEVKTPEKYIAGIDRVIYGASYGSITAGMYLAAKGIIHTELFQNLWHSENLLSKGGAALLGAGSVLAGGFLLVAGVKAMKSILPETFGEERFGQVGKYYKVNTTLDNIALGISTIDIYNTLNVPKESISENQWVIPSLITAGAIITANAFGTVKRETEAVEKNIVPSEEKSFTKRLIQERNNNQALQHQI